MDDVSVIKVNSGKEMDDFIHVVDDVYRDYPQYVPDFEKDVRGVFDRRTNPGMEFSDIQPFVAYRHDVPVGRIVGIINRKANKKWQQRNVRFSMIEFMDDQAVSAALIEAVSEWGKARGMTSIHGPLGVTDFDKEGMLIEDFNLTGSMTAIYNPAVLSTAHGGPGLREGSGLATGAHQYSGGRARQICPCGRICPYEHRPAREETQRQTDDGRRGAQDIRPLQRRLYPHLRILGIVARADRHFLDKYLTVIVDLNMVPVIENDKGEVVGAAVTMGSLVKALQKAHGRLLPFGWFHLLKALKWKRAESVEMLLIAVRPDYQGLGLNAMFFDNLIPIYNKLGIKWAETGPQLEDNVRELTQWKPLKPEYVKRRRCFVREIG